jgi:adenine-specific DNA methylase
MPTTRYQGSKRKIADWIWSQLESIPFDTVLDAFGGTGSVSHRLKRAGKAVTYNDILRFNAVVGRALIENRTCRLSDEDLAWITQRHRNVDYPDFIERSFEGIYFTRDENRWLDMACANIRCLEDPYRQALAYGVVGQAALVKRPYNLFHRRNLYMRTASVPRTFGNKATWDRPFPEHVRRFAAEANRAVFDSGRPCRATHADVAVVEPGFDLVYIDTPYVSGRGVGVDYHGFYHFLEGLVDYAAWPDRIDWTSRHRRLRAEPTPWTSRARIGSAFRALFARFASSTLVVSYRSDGIPSIEQLAQWLGDVKSTVSVHHDSGRKAYALSTNGRAHEVLLVGTD